MSIVQYWSHFLVNHLFAEERAATNRNADLDILSATEGPGCHTFLAVVIIIFSKHVPH